VKSVFDSLPQIVSVFHSSSERTVIVLVYSVESSSVFWSGDFRRLIKRIEKPVIAQNENPMPLFQYELTDGLGRVIPNRDGFHIVESLSFGNQSIVNQSLEAFRFANGRRISIICHIGSFERIQQDICLHLDFGCERLPSC
jgi:hypothetical protein